MRTLGFFAFVLLSGIWVVPQTQRPNTSSTPSPQTVQIVSGNLHLKAFFWKPQGPGPFPAVLFNHGSGGATASETAGMPMTDAAEILAPPFVRHGYAFLYLFRRGQGLSATQAPFMQDLLKREELAHGKELRQHLQFVLLTTEQLDDVMAALAFLKTAPGIDPKHIAIVGHSFGGQLTLLAAKRDNTLRAVVTFGAAANSWQGSPDLRALLLTAVSNTKAPVMLVHAANDYDTSAGRDLAAERERLHTPVLLKIYPPVGATSDDGHNFIYSSISIWEDEVFDFLNTYCKH